MFLELEKVNRSYAGYASFLGSGEKSAEENKNTNVSQTAKVTGTLAGLAVLGYAGVKVFKSKPGSLKLEQEIIPSEVLQKFRNWFDEIRDIKASIWVSKSGEPSQCIANPKSEECLKMLDNLTPIEKKAFVQEYCSITGFPDLDMLSSKIDKDILSVIDKMAVQTGCKPLFVGYDINSSVGRRRALPGSDCDGLFVLYDSDFQGPMWDHILLFGDLINQRLLNISGSHYPDMLGINFIKHNISKVEDIFSKIATPDRIAEYENNLSYDGKSYVKAAQFNIDIAQNLTKDEKDAVCWAGFFVEELRSGKVILNNLSDADLNFIKNSALYKYSNMTRQEGLKSKLKPKLDNRVELSRCFMQMNDEEKFEVCRDLLKNSLGLKSESLAKDSFEKFDMGDIIEMYKKTSNFFNDQNT